MRKLYQILYNVGRLTDAPGGGLFLSRGDTLAGGRFPFLGDTLAVGRFPFLGDTLAWAGLRGGKALRVTNFPAFSKQNFSTKNPTTLWKETPSSFPLEDPQTVLSDFYPQESPHHP